MSRRPRTPAADPHRKANFREEARGIVAKDRYDRKYGHAVDTAGAIARALERAYKQGFADAQDDPSDRRLKSPTGGHWSGCSSRPVPETRSGPAVCSRSADAAINIAADTWSLTSPNAEQSAGVSSSPALHPTKPSAQAQSNRWSGSACWKAIRQNHTV